MRIRTVGVFTAAVLAASMTARAQQPAPAQQANPTPGCTATPAQLAENRKVAMDFFRLQGDERVALADPSYKQHNPAFKKRAEDAGVSDYQEFKNAFSSAALAARGRGPGRGGRGPGAGAPPGNPFEIVTAECDIVTMVHMNNRPDPTAPGKFYQAFTFDTFRIKNGKLVEHWDGAVINPPAPEGAGRGRN